MAKVRIQFTLSDDSGKELHTSDLVYSDLDKQGVLFIEKHLIGFLADMNTEAAAFEASKSGSVGV